MNLDSFCYGVTVAPRQHRLAELSCFRLKPLRDLGRRILAS
jgi:hypothetical protein